MKYQLLTKEQFEELHKEFSVFLASQQINEEEWKEIKANKPHIVKEELAVFSDMVWEDVLSKTSYIQHISDHYINLFHCLSQEMIRICVKFTIEEKSFLNLNDFDWFLKNPLNKGIEYYKASKKYSKPRNIEIFELIKVGGVITNEKLFQQISKMMTN